MKRILFYVLLLACFSTGAQTVLLNVERPSEQIIATRGPNLKKFTYASLRMAFVAPGDKAGARIVYGGSVNVAFSIRTKYKISPVYSMGFEIEPQYTDYKLKQTGGKVFPDTVINNISERMDYSSLGIGFFNRFNFDPGRGNFLGHFFDIGIMGLWDYSITHVTKNKLPDGTHLKNETTKLPFVNKLNAKVVARIGYSHLSLYGSYRLTDLFKASSGYPDLPRLIIGIEMGLFGV